MRILLWLAAVAVLPGELLAAEPAEPSASELIAKSEAAYAAVKTYVGSTKVHVKTGVENTTVEDFATAKVSFIRPGKIRIEGRTASHDASGNGGNPFTIIGDGHRTWKSWAKQNDGAFAEVKSVPMAGLGGVTRGAAELIPAALMRSDGVWVGGDDPFIVPRLSEVQLGGHEQIDGADCYKVLANHPRLGNIALWIDSKSFLLRQMTREYSETQLAEFKKNGDEALKKIGKQRPEKVPAEPASKSKFDVYSFIIDQVDGPVDAKLFAAPSYF